MKFFLILAILVLSSSLSYSKDVKNDTLNKFSPKKPYLLQGESIGYSPFYSKQNRSYDSSSLIVDEIPGLEKIIQDDPRKHSIFFRPMSLFGKSGETNRYSDLALKTIHQENIDEILGDGPSNLILYSKKDCNFLTSYVRKIFNTLVLENNLEAYLYNDGHYQFGVRVNCGNQYKNTIANTTLRNGIITLHLSVLYYSLYEDEIAALLAHEIQHHLLKHELILTHVNKYLELNTDIEAGSWLSSKPKVSLSPIWPREFLERAEARTDILSSKLLFNSGYNIYGDVIFRNRILDVYDKAVFLPRGTNKHSLAILRGRSRELKARLEIMYPNLTSAEHKSFVPIPTAVKNSVNSFMTSEEDYIATSYPLILTEDLIPKN